jgi:hypothetical protein
MTHNESAWPVPPLVMSGLGDSRHRGDCSNALRHQSSVDIPGSIRTGTDIAVMRMEYQPAAALWKTL